MRLGVMMGKRRYRGPLENGRIGGHGKVEIRGALGNGNTEGHEKAELGHRRADIGHGKPKIVGAPGIRSALESGDHGRPRKEVIRWALVKWRNRGSWESGDAGSNIAGGDGSK